MEFEFAILDGIQEIFGGPFFDFLMPKITVIGNAGIGSIILSLILICIPKYRKTGIAMAIALAVSLVVGNLLMKPLIGRVRPCDINTAFPLLIERPHDGSFPSGHTYGTVLAAVVLYLRESKRFWIPAAVIALLVAFSRMYLYVHYPTDILGGIVMGLIFGFVGVYVVKKVRWFDRFDAE